MAINLWDRKVYMRVEFGSNHFRDNSLIDGPLLMRTDQDISFRPKLDSLNSYQNRHHQLTGSRAKEVCHCWTDDVCKLKRNIARHCCGYVFNKQRCRFKMAGYWLPLRSDSVFLSAGVMLFILLPYEFINNLPSDARWYGLRSLDTFLLH